MDRPNSRGRVASGGCLFDCMYAYVVGCFHICFCCPALGLAAGRRPASYSAWFFFCLCRAPFNACPARPRAQGPKISHLTKSQNPPDRTLGFSPSRALATRRTYVWIDPPKPLVSTYNTSRFFPSVSVVQYITLSRLTSGLFAPR